MYEYINVSQVCKEMNAKFSLKIIRNSTYNPWLAFKIQLFNWFNCSIVHSIQWEKRLQHLFFLPLIFLQTTVWRNIRGAFLSGVNFILQWEHTYTIIHFTNKTWDFPGLHILLANFRVLTQQFPDIKSLSEQSNIHTTGPPNASF